MPQVPVVVIVPGIMGTELFRPRPGASPEQVWPGTAWEWAFGHGRMDDLLADDVYPGELIGSYLKIPQYASLLATLDALGYRRRSTPPTLYTFPYDWRRDARLAASNLAARLHRILEEHRGRAELHLVAHSLGGLICRYVLESGRFPELTSTGAIRSLVTMGTPHLGAPLALLGARGEEPRIFLKPEQVGRMARDRRYPSVYQLISPAEVPILADGRAASGRRPLPHLDAAALDLEEANLAAAQQLRAAIAGMRPPEGCRYFCIAGTLHDTVEGLRARRYPRPTRLDRDDVEGCGDGTVPAWSAWPSGTQGAYVGGEHGTIYRHWRVRPLLAGLLPRGRTLDGLRELAPDRLATPLAALTLPQVVPGKDPSVRAILEFPGGRDQLEGVLEVAPAEPESQPEGRALATPGRSKELRYRGPLVHRMAIEIDASDLDAGTYQVVLRVTNRRGRLAPVAHEYFLRQSPSD